MRCTGGADLTKTEDELVKIRKLLQKLVMNAFQRKDTTKEANVKA